MPETDPAPRALQLVIGLLLLNLAVSIGVTAASLADIDGLVRFAFAHKASPNLDPDSLRHALRLGLYFRAAGNVAVGVAYVILARRLLGAQRRAWRRAVRLSVLGVAGFGYLLTQPYPVGFKAEQAVQLALLAAIAGLLLHPSVRGFFTSRPAGMPVVIPPQQPIDLTAGSVAGESQVIREG